MSPLASKFRSTTSFHCPALESLKATLLATTPALFRKLRHRQFTWAQAISNPNGVPFHSQPSVNQASGALEGSMNPIFSTMKGQYITTKIIKALLHNAFKKTQSQQSLPLLK